MFSNRDFAHKSEDFKHMEKIFLIPPSDMSDKLPFILTLAGITYPDAEYKIYRECSELYVIEYVEKGAGTVICGSESYRIEKGDVYILPAGFEHRYYSDKKEPWKKKWMNVSGELCERLTEIYGIDKRVHFPKTDIGGLFDELFDYLAKHPADNEINSYSAIIFHRMIQRLAENSEKKHTGTAQNVKSFIDCNIYRKINAELVAEKFRFSVSQLSRLFKREYGATVYNYILEQKIATAEKLLQNSSLTVKQIADMLNFTDEHYFCNIFKKKRGVTPGRIRK